METCLSFFLKNQNIFVFQSSKSYKTATVKTHAFKSKVLGANSIHIKDFSSFIKPAQMPKND
jgi:hypothetical protein